MLDETTVAGAAGTTTGAIGVTLQGAGKVDPMQQFLAAAEARFAALEKRIEELGAALASRHPMGL